MLKCVSKISRRVDGVLVCVGWINNTTPVENLLNDISVSSQNKLQLTTSNSSRICKTKKNLLWGEMRGDQFTTESKSIKTWNYIQLTVLLKRMVVKHYILILKYKKTYTQTHKTVLLGEKTQLHMFEGNIQYFCNYNKAVNGNTQRSWTLKSCGKCSKIEANLNTSLIKNIMSELGCLSSYLIDRQCFLWVQNCRIS